ncbi:hypothetical protein SAMN05444338_103148 [Flavobacterium degerlachei]|uniref:Uncharacterized protein n=1 Tax=Flavobacterium degerlachei TaxID=229203 RepID=A0A1H2UDS8_9FLAO|nr:hypothetical protein SAMN05444338_103148 [Flavobacterium degerlachei]
MIDNLIIREYKTTNKDSALAVLKLNVPDFFAKS